MWFQSLKCNVFAISSLSTEQIQTYWVFAARRPPVPPGADETGHKPKRFRSASFAAVYKPDVVGIKVAISADYLSPAKKIIRLLAG